MLLQTCSVKPRFSFCLSKRMRHTLRNRSTAALCWWIWAFTTAQPCINCNLVFTVTSLFPSRDNSHVWLEEMIPVIIVRMGVTWTERLKNVSFSFVKHTSEGWGWLYRSPKNSFASVIDANSPECPQRFQHNPFVCSSELVWPVCTLWVGWLVTMVITIFLSSEIQQQTIFDAFTQLNHLIG